MPAQFVPYKLYLETGVTTEVQQRLHNLKVPFIDSDMQGRLPSLIASIQVRTASVQDFDNSALISKGGMVNGSVSIFILSISKESRKKS